MSLFSLKKSTERTGVIIDIGSGSVLVAVVVSDRTKEKPLVVWSHREQAPLRNIDSVDQAAKSVMTSLINALLKFDGEGRKALYEFNKKTVIDEVQCAICAPWSYTVSKRISYTQEEPFSVTKSLITELVGTALEQTNAELHEHEAVNELGLTIITRCTTDILVNGYRVKELPDSKASELSLSHISVVAQQYLVDHLEDLRHKIFSNRPLRKLSYMLAMYSVAEESFDDSGDFCLVDVTYEATEIGVVRDGVLTYSTHTPYGSFSLARDQCPALPGLPVLACGRATAFYR
jgi:cell division ATPase FtsA